MESRGLKISFRGDYSELIASLSLAATGVEELRGTAEDVREAGTASSASPRKLEGKLNLTKTAVARRFAREALKPIYKPIADVGGPPPGAVRNGLRRREGTLQSPAPRLIIGSSSLIPRTPPASIQRLWGQAGLPA